MEKSGRVALVLALALAAGCRGAGPADGGLTTVRVAVGGQSQLIYLPTTLARELGFYKEEGLNVEIEDLQGGAKALEAAVGGSTDVVSGFYDHTIQMAAEGREFVAFVTMLRFPGLVLVASPQRAGTITRIEDLKGKILGVTSAGSSSHMLLRYLLQQHGVPADGASITAIGTAATAIAAIERGKVDAGIMADPAFTLMMRRNSSAHVLADLRQGEGVAAALGTKTYPASVLYAKGEWIRAHRDTTERLARAIRRTLLWMKEHTPQEIAAKTPAAFRGEDLGLYIEALKNSMPMYSPDGMMDPAGAEAVHAMLSQSMDKVRGATIDLSKTYTNEFVTTR
jgi:NitT/TauT family transport system substrate-binding protein